MSLGAILDVVIGLAFTYLLLGMLASGFQEFWVALTNKRGKELQAGITQLLAGSTGGGNLANLGKTVLGHSLIQDLSPKNGMPSYVPARNFALALFEALRDGGHGPLFSQIEGGVARLPDGSAKQSLTAFISHAGSDLDTLQKKVETWFDDAMDRVSGIYKRFSQYFTLGFGLAAAIVFNVDSINLASTLWTNPTVRNAVVNMAQQSAAVNQTVTAGDLKNRINTVTDELQKLPLPIGWMARDGDDEEKGKAAYELFWHRLTKADGTGLLLLIGWLITGLATSLGAPFWFDSLKRLLQLRNAGPKPPRADATVSNP